MHCEQRGDHETRRRVAGERAQHEEEQGDVEYVEEDVLGVMRLGVEGEELHIDHVGDPRERMPVRRVDAGEGPADVVQREAVGDRGIDLDVGDVVEVDETSLECGSIARGGERAEHQQQEDPTASGGHRRAVSGRSIGPEGGGGADPT